MPTGAASRRTLSQEFKKVRCSWLRTVNGSLGSMCLKKVLDFFPSPGFPCRPCPAAPFSCECSRVEFRWRSAPWNSVAEALTEAWLSFGWRGVVEVIPVSGRLLSTTAPCSLALDASEGREVLGPSETTGCFSSSLLACHCVRGGSLLLRVIGKRFIQEVLRASLKATFLFS